MCAECVLAPLLLPDNAERLSDWPLLVLYLAEQHYYLARGLPCRSTAWSPYLKSLPQARVGTVLEWPLDEVSVIDALMLNCVCPGMRMEFARTERQPGLCGASTVCQTLAFSSATDTILHHTNKQYTNAAQVSKLLTGSGSLLKAQIILAAAEAQWREVQPIISTAKQQGLLPPDMFSRADIDFGTSICLSRTVRLDDKGGVVVLSPMADLFNHSCDSTAFLVWDEQQQAVVLRADRAYNPGEEVGVFVCVPE